VLCASVERGAAIITYHVIVGPFIIIVKMLNIEDEINNSSASIILGKGGSGSIVARCDGKEQFVAKRMEFKKKLHLIKATKDQSDWMLTATYSEVEQAVIECGFTKICSLLGIGPKMKLDMGFDLVCSRTSIEFYMERCEQIKYRPKGVTVETIQRRLRYCVAILHKYRLVHKDIKPINILYSHHRRNYVLCDFGISRPIQ
jgi:hypothetical protein